MQENREAERGVESFARGDRSPWEVRVGDNVGDPGWLPRGPDAAGQSNARRKRRLRLAASKSGKRTPGAVQISPQRRSPASRSMAQTAPCSQPSASQIASRIFGAASSKRGRVDQRPSGHVFYGEETVRGFEIHGDRYAQKLSRFVSRRSGRLGRHRDHPSEAGPGRCKLIDLPCERENSRCQRVSAANEPRERSGAFGAPRAPAFATEALRRGRAGALAEAEACKGVRGTKSPGENT